MVRADRRAPAHNRIRQNASLKADRSVPAPVRAEERLALCVESHGRLQGSEEREVVAPLPEAGPVEDHPAVHLDLGGVQVALEVRRVVERVPQAELDRSNHGERRGVRAVIRDANRPCLERLAGRDEVDRLDLDPLAGGTDHRVAEAVTAPVALQLPLRRLPERRPIRAVRLVAKVEVATVLARGDVVVPVAGEPAQASVAVEHIAAAGIRDETDQGRGPQVVEPGDRGVRPEDDILPPRIVKVPAPHGRGPPIRITPADSHDLTGFTAGHRIGARRVPSGGRRARSPRRLLLPVRDDR